jgi:hypothetical protein
VSKSLSCVSKSHLWVWKLHSSVLKSQFTCKNHTQTCQNHTHACGYHTRLCKNWVCILKKFTWLSNNIFKKWHVWVWISYANVSFSHVCVLIFFETQFITVWNESNKNICSNIRKTTLNVNYGIVFHLFMLWYSMINV